MKKIIIYLQIIFLFFYTSTAFAVFPIKLEKEDSLDENFNIKTQIEISEDGTIYGETKIKSCYITSHLGVILIELRDEKDNILYKESETILIKGNLVGCQEITENWSKNFDKPNKIKKVAIKHNEKTSQEKMDPGIISSIIAVVGGAAVVFLKFTLENW